MKFTGLKALLAALSVICAVLLPVQNVVAAEAEPAAKVCADGKPCPAEDKAADKKPTDEEPTDEELEDSCEDDGVF